MIPLNTEPWVKDSACRVLAPADADRLFFPERGTNPAAAVALCTACPVTAECKSYGATEEYGMWGGTTSTERGFGERSSAA